MPRIARTWLALLLVFSFVAAACGGESSDEAVEGDDTDEPTEATDDTDEPAADDEPATDDDDTDEPAADDDDDAPAGEPNFYEDPRGGVFADFQATWDRSDHPFAQVDAFCLPHPAAEDRVDGDHPGITADTITIGHIRSKLEDADAFGFFVPVGDPKEMFEVFVAYINDECGGVRGRTLELAYVEAELLGDEVDASRNAACLAMTDDSGSVVVVNSTGFQGSANLCIVEEQATAFWSTQGQTEEFIGRAVAPLISVSPTLEESLRFLVGDLLASGALDGATIGTVAPDTPGQPEAVENGLVQPLRDAGFDVVFDTVQCGGGTICQGGVAESVTNMVSAGVDVFFNTMNILTAPGYIAEMASQGYEPGDVQFYASDFNSQAAELVAGQITNDPEAGDLYNGAIIIDYRDTGAERVAGFEPNPFQETCNDLYGEGSGIRHLFDTPGDSAYNMTGSVCAILRNVVRALYDAGDNPSEADVWDALLNLGPVDANEMTPSSVTPDKPQIPDVIQTMDFSFPCDLPIAYELRSGGAICITGRGDWRAAPR